eukprot:PhM_4_TR14202/c0_g1_i1/m.70140/K15013/ACSBG; long-chain-fatty-acid--CoA ligase ACSBG
MASYVAAAGLGAVALYALKPSYYPNKLYTFVPESGDFLSNYGDGLPVFDTKLDGTHTIRLSKKGVASRKSTTMLQMMRDIIAQQGDKTALRIEKNNHTENVGEWMSISWKQYWNDSAAFAKALVAIDFMPCRSVAICAFNHTHWHFAHTGAMMAGGKSAGVYPTNTPDACEYIVEHAESEVVVVDTVANLKKFLEVKARMPLVKHVVVFQEDIPAEITEQHRDYVLSWADFVALGAKVTDEQLQQRIDKVSNASPCSLIYTSGTTGHPKAVTITHDSVWFMCASVFDTVQLQPVPQEDYVSYLPLSHIAAQVLDLAFPVWVAHSLPNVNATVHFARPDALKGSLGVTLKAVNPTMFLGVPRVWEKFVEGIKAKAKAAPATGLKKRLVEWAKDVGLRAARAQQADGDGVIPRGYWLADRLVYSKVREALGLTRARYLMTGAAPITKETLMSLASLGVIVFELYGMSECSGATTMSMPKIWKWGSCGVPMNGMEVAIKHEPTRDEPGNGEICFRGRHIMMGYMKSEDKSRDAIDAEGWLHSGDVGRIDEHGLLYITGRIKELIIGAGGENIAPVPIETEIKRLCPAISNIVMIGDKRKYNVALISLKCEPNLSDGSFTDALMNEALSLNPSVKTVSAARNDPIVKKAIENAIKEYNTGHTIVSNAQKIQYFRILPTDLSVPGGELTATLKLKRDVITKKYVDLIDEMY